MTPNWPEVFFVGEHLNYSDIQENFSASKNHFLTHFHFQDDSAEPEESKTEYSLQFTKYEFVI